MSHKGFGTELAGAEFAARVTELLAGQGPDLGELQERVLAECDARVREIQAGAAPLELADDRLAPLLQLITVARRAAALKSEGAAAADPRGRGIELTFEALADLAHKINNPLTSLLGRAQILQMKKDLDPQVLKASQVIEESAKRVAEHIRELNQLIRTARENLLGPNATVQAPSRGDR